MSFVVVELARQKQSKLCNYNQLTKKGNSYIIKLRNQWVDKNIDALEVEVKRIVSVFLELKKKDKKWSQKKTEIGKRLKKLLVRIEEFSGEGKD